MNDDRLTATGTAEEIQPTSTPATPELTSSQLAGSLLRSAREDQGIHIAALAVLLKVSVKKLQALEAGDLEVLPSLVFARTLAASVCRQLKLDPNTVLQHLPSVKRAASVSHSHHAMHHGVAIASPGKTIWQSMESQLSSPLIFAALALVLGAVALILLPNMLPTVDTTKTAVVAAAKPISDAGSMSSANLIAVQPTASAPVTIAALAAPAVAAVASGVVATASTTDNNAAAIAPVPAPTASAQQNLLVNALMSGSSNPLATNSTAQANAKQTALHFKARDAASWIQVSDANSKMIYEGLLSAGQAVDVRGEAPVRVTIGRAHAVEVSIDGKPFDIQALAKGEVARFEVQP